MHGKDKHQLQDDGYIWGENKGKEIGEVYTSPLQSVSVIVQFFKILQKQTNKQTLKCIWLNQS